VGVVGAADQRAALDVLEAEREAEFAEASELLGLVVAAHREVVLGGPEVLADGKYVHVVIAQVAHRLVYFLFHFAEADHKTALGQTLGVELLGVAEYLQGALVLGLRADRVVEAGDRLDVVVEGVGAGVYDGLYCVAIPLEIWGKDLDGAAGDFFPDRAYGPGEDRSPTVRELVAVDARDHGVLEAHLLGGVGHAMRLVEVQLRGLTGEHGAEAARTGTDVAEDHERGGAVVPALADVRAAGLLAHRVEVEAAHGLLDIPVDLAVGDARLQPLGTAMRTGQSSRLLAEGQIFRRGSIRRRGHGPVFPAVADLESLGAVVEYSDVDLSARHGSPIFLAL
jgi:hypothetical protein